MFSKYKIWIRSVNSDKWQEFIFKKSSNISLEANWPITE